VTERIPYLTVSERADLHSLSFNEELALERDQPWIKSWAARYGAAPERLRAWLAAGRPAADRTALSVVGDTAIVDAVRAVVAKLPEAVAHFLVGHVTFFCGGVSSRGWHRPALRPPCELARWQWINLSTTDDAIAIAAHECAHAFQTKPLPYVFDAPELGRLRAGMTKKAVEDGTVDELIEDALRFERAADELASAWMGYRVDTTSGHRGDSRRRFMRQEIERIASTTPGASSGRASRAP
jgi:hypothetical protein